MKHYPAEIVEGWEYRLRANMLTMITAHIPEDTEGVMVLLSAQEALGLLDYLQRHESHLRAMVAMPEQPSVTIER